MDKNKQKNKKTKQNTRFRNNRISVLVYFSSYSSIIQSWSWCISRSSDMVSPGDWLVSNVLFFCLPVKLKLWCEVAFPDHAGWSALLISLADSCVTLQLQLFGQLLLQWGGEVQVWMLASGSGDLLCSPLAALFWRWLFSVFVYWNFHDGRLFLCPVLILWSRFSVPISPLCCLFVIMVCCLFFSFSE
jgi:hypothetical protein